MSAPTAEHRRLEEDARRTRNWKRWGPLRLGGGRPARLARPPYGVAQIFGVHFSGFVAWWLWRTIYLTKLPRLEKRLRVAIDWTWDLLFSKDLVKFLSRRSETISRPQADVADAMARAAS